MPQRCLSKLLKTLCRRVQEFFSISSATFWWAQEKDPNFAAFPTFPVDFGLHDYSAMSWNISDFVPVSSWIKLEGTGYDSSYDMSCHGEALYYKGTSFDVLPFPSPILVPQLAKMSSGRVGELQKGVVFEAYRSCFWTQMHSRSPSWKGTLLWHISPSIHGNSYSCWMRCKPCSRQRRIQISYDYHWWSNVYCNLTNVWYLKSQRRKYPALKLML